MKRFIEDDKETKHISEEEAVDDGDADAGDGNEDDGGDDEKRETTTTTTMIISWSL